ncbi:polyprenyl diphosphate synthase [Streptomyces collinus]|uniref:polyprenyl diphosphate synthase n=1 Tax=Streptomyces collinus TaxID=42684 RepID=UPI0036CF0399
MNSIEKVSHIACILDGNRRWAVRNGLEPTAGHEAGKRVIPTVVSGCTDRGVSWLTLFSFSTENWERDRSEVDSLMRVHRDIIHCYGPHWKDFGIRVRYLGRQDERIPSGLLDDIDRIEEETGNNSKMNLTFAFDHGGRREIARALKGMLQDQVSPDEVTESKISSYMKYPEIPEIDLLIRTGGERRISNFMIWQIVYAELYFLDIEWPEFSVVHLEEAITEYMRRNRTRGVGSR